MVRKNIKQLMDTNDFGSDREIAKKILALIFKRNAYSHLAMSVLKSEYFIAPVDGIFKLLIDIYTKYDTKIPSINTVKAYIVGKKEFKERNVAILNDIIEGATALIGNPDDDDDKIVSGEIVEFAKKRALSQAIMRESDKISKGNYNEVGSDIEKAMRIGSDVFDVGTIYKDDFRGILNRINNNYDNFITTGIDSLDAAMGGGIQPRQFGMVIGPTGRGKSIFLMNLAASAMYHDKNVIYYTLEMPEDDIAKRISSNFTNMVYSIDTEKHKGMIDKLEAKLKKVQGNLVIKEFEMENTTVEDLKAHCEMVEFNTGKKIDLILVDSAYHLVARGKFDGDVYNMQDHIFKMLRGWAMLGPAIWTADQTNTNSYSTEIVEMSDIHGSRGKIHATEVIISLSQTLKEEFVDKMRLFICKMRNNKMNYPIDVRYAKDVMIIRDWRHKTEDDDNPKIEDRDKSDDYKADKKWASVSLEDKRRMSSDETREKQQEDKKNKNNNNKNIKGKLR